MYVRKHQTVVGISIISLGILILFALIYRNSQFSAVNQTFSPYTITSSTWEKYKQQFINQDGRVIDHGQNSITTSEGQSYAMLRAVWEDDKQSFDQVWNWTQQNLKRPEDNLFGWKWGQRTDGSYGFLPEGGEASATDADSDIALALILAARRWNQDEYIYQAIPILNDIWEYQTAIASDKRYLIAGPWAQNEEYLVINPSYFAPYAWRTFSQIDPDHDWDNLIDPAYKLLTQATQDPLDHSLSANLPPDWVRINRQTGELSAPEEEHLTTNYGYDAIRVPWRIALDYLWYQEPQAKEYLSNHFGHLQDEYTRTGQIMAGYNHAGQPIYNFESPATYATAIGYFMIVHPQLADQMYQNKIITLYSNDTNSFSSDLGYYEQNWLWFGIGLYHQKLIPFT